MSEWGAAGGEWHTAHHCLLSRAGDITRGVDVEAGGRSPARRGNSASGGGGGLARGVAQAAAASSKAEQLRVVVSAAAGAVRVGSGWRVRAQRGGCSTKLHRHAPVVRACRSRVASRRSSLCRRSDVLLSCYHRTGGRAARRGAVAGGQRQAGAPVGDRRRTGEVPLSSVPMKVPELQNLFSPSRTLEVIEREQTFLWCHLSSKSSTVPGLDVGISRSVRDARSERGGVGRGLYQECGRSDQGKLGRVQGEEHPGARHAVRAMVWALQSHEAPVRQGGHARQGARPEVW